MWLALGLKGTRHVKTPATIRSTSQPTPIERQAMRGNKITGRWFLEVCRTCHRRAVWPFCEHKEDNGDWFVTVNVSGRIEPRLDGEES